MTIKVLEHIQVIHDSVYQYLTSLNEKDASFKFRMHHKGNNFLDKKNWFPDNNDILYMSFWAYDDDTTNFPTILLYFPNEGTDKKLYFTLITSKNNVERNTYFEKMSARFELEQNNFMHLSWDKEMDVKSNILTTLHHFILNEKPKIDAYIQANPEEGIVGFISDEDFLKEKAAMDTYRDKHLSEAVWQASQVLLEDFRLDGINSKQVLPNALSRLYVADFQGIKHLTIDNIPLSSRWIFLTGENGFGKTSILRAIAKGLIGDEPLVFPKPKEATILLNALINNKPFKYDDIETTAIMPVAAYGVSRFQLSASDQAASDRSKQKTYSLFHDDGQLINIEQELITTNAYNPARFKALRSIFLRILPNLKDIKIDTTNGSPKVRYCEQDAQQQSYGYRALNELAAGYRSILTMMGDMVIRLSEGKDNLNDLSGIVLIDEIDAHLHPKYQYELPKLLSNVFPKVQFIVTTHSPMPILGLPEDNKPVILTVERNPENGISVDRKDDDFDIRQLNPLSLLTSPVFGFQALFARGAKSNTIIASDDFDDVEKIEKIKNRLKTLREQGAII